MEDGIGSNTKPVDIGDNTNDSDDETQETRGVESALTKQTKKRKHTSDVWDHFRRLPREPNKPEYAECMKCGSKYLCASNMGTGGQQQNDEDVQEVQEVRKRRQPNKAEKKAWMSAEETALAKAWVHISTCKIVGNEQTRDSFWKRILEHFKQNVKDTTRTYHGLNTKLQNMNAAMSVFNGLFIQQKRLRESGCSDVDIMKNALVDYNKKTGKSFSHIEAWEIVRLEAKWLEQPDVAQASLSHSDKRRKSSESGNYESGSNDNTVIPDLNDDTNPTRKRKGKKTDSESSTKGSVAASFDIYTARKTQLLETVVEKKLANDELAEKLLAAQIRSVEEKALFRAMKFYNQPHDHITDPNMLAFTLAKKRELANKYGWSCDF